MNSESQLTTPPLAEALAWVARLHQAVDEAAAPLLQQHATRLQCRPGCAACCLDDLTVFTLEAVLIAHHHTSLLSTGHPHSPGACAFLDGGGSCRVYAQRPYVCRTQGLPLRWAEPSEEGVVQELRDICPLNARTFSAADLSLEVLPASALWTLGPFESRLAAAQARHDGGALRRVALRALFGGVNRPQPA